jgi:putative sugar O-methyltransferase
MSVEPNPMKTSISDFPEYRSLCHTASFDDKFFQQFRDNSHIKGVYECVSEPLGLQCLDAVKRDNPTLLEHLPEFIRNDAVGTPNLVDYPGYGKICPTTARYIKVLSDLLKHFGSLDGFRIAEIGIGYGGQCRIIGAATSFTCYTLIDLREPLELTRRYLACFNPLPTRYRTMEQLVPESYDLVISNYAFCELDRQVQAEYVRTVIDSAARGYMLCNFDISSWFRIDSMNLAEVQALKPEIRVLPEDPATHTANQLLVWNIAQ